MKKYLLAGIIALAMPAYACQEAELEAEFETRPFTSLEKGMYSHYDKQANLVFSDRKMWESHYKAAHDENVPAVDFTKEMILAVYMGTKPNSAYSVEVKQIRNLPPSLDVLVQTTCPVEGNMYLQVITHPYHIVKIEKTSKPIGWTYISATEECPKPPEKEK